MCSRLLSTGILDTSAKDIMKPAWRGWSSTSSHPTPAPTLSKSQAQMPWVQRVAALRGEPFLEDFGLEAPLLIHFSLCDVSNICSSNFVAAHGVRQKPEQKIAPEKFDFSGISEDDKVWVDLMIRAGGRCGYDPTKMSENVRAIVEEAMAISLKLISDERYNKIEEISQDVNSGAGARDKAWKTAKSSFLDSLYNPYKDRLPRKVSQCPKIEPAADPTPAPVFGAFNFGK